MSHSITNPLLNQGTINRDDLLTVISVGFRQGEHRFIRQAVLTWLAAYPGDLQFNLFYAQSLLEEKKPAQAVPILETICTADPEFITAQEMLFTAYVLLQKPIGTIASTIYALTGKEVEGNTPSAWSKAYRLSQEAFDQEKLEDAELSIQQALISDPNAVLPAIFHLELAAALHDNQTILNLANLYHERWPDCLPITLYLAAAIMSAGDDTRAVALLHQTVAKDAAGQVVSRIWGEDHTYRRLWPETMQIRFDMPVPGSISAALGWNLLTSSEKPEATSSPVTPEVEAQVSAETSPAVEPPAEMIEDIPLESDATRPNPAADGEKKIPESLQDIRDELERIAGRLRMPGVTRTDGRFPVYVVLTTRKGLESLYGNQTSFVLDELMKQVVETIRKKQGWNAILFYVDDPSCTAAFGIKPAPYNDPWKIKLAIADLDKALAKRGEMIGTLFIVGGPDVVPFHHLPNPTEDSDTQIGSDNPYATLDDNYFIPEWPVGRLPGGVNHDAGLIMQYLRKMIIFHSEQSAQEPWWRRVSVFSPIFNSMRRVFAHGLAGLRPAFGYTAAVWGQASIEVYRTIGDSQSLLSSPPIRSGQLVGSGYLPARLAYFNLHGVSDSVEWYGQPDFEEVKEYPDYPVALTPKDILNDGNAPLVVYSEACYGAFIEGKTDEQALSLKFLLSGTKAMVGCTCVAYGSVSTPLIGADILGSYFWKQVKDGVPVGEALRNAKVLMAQEMTKRQGFLDGEDQKTMISFVLYGDPLVTLAHNKKMEKTIQRERIKSPVLTVCQSSEHADTFAPVNADMMNQVKQIVEQYLPGLNNASYTFAKQYASQVNSRDSKNKTIQAIETERTVVTVKKEYRQNKAHAHTHFARLTIDQKGKVVKLAVSR